MASLPDEFQQIIQQQLDLLIHQHEHVMLKFIGKVRPNVEFEEGDIRLNRKELFELIFILSITNSWERRTLAIPSHANCFFNC